MHCLCFHWVIGILMDVWLNSEKLWELLCSLQLPTPSLVLQTFICISINNRNMENVFYFVNNKFDFNTYTVYVIFYLCELRFDFGLIKKQSLHHRLFSCCFSLLQEKIDNLSHSWRWRLPKAAQLSAQSHQQDFPPWESQETNLPGFLW